MKPTTTLTPKPADPKTPVFGKLETPPPLSPPPTCNYMVQVQGHPGFGKTFLCSLLDKDATLCVDTDDLSQEVADKLLADSQYKRLLGDTYERKMAIKYDPTLSEQHKTNLMDKLDMDIDNPYYMPELNRRMSAYLEQCMRERRVLVMVGVTIHFDNLSWQEVSHVAAPAKTLYLRNDVSRGETLAFIYRRLCERELQKVVDAADDLRKIVRSSRVSMVAQDFSHRSNLAVPMPLDWFDFVQHVNRGFDDAAAKGWQTGTQTELAAAINDMAAMLRSSSAAFGSNMSEGVVLSTNKSPPGKKTSIVVRSPPNAGKTNPFAGVVRMKPSPSSQNPLGIN